MLSEQKAPSGPRPSRQNENFDPNATRTRIVSGSKEPPTLTASSRNNHSLFSYGNLQSTEDTQSSIGSSYDFLPSVSFDDLHSSIATASNEFFRTAESSPTLPNGFDDMKRQTPIDDNMNRAGNDARAPVPARTATTATRPGRSGSILRRQSVSTRQNSTASTTSAISSANESATVAPATRTRRQPQYPPISGTGATKGSRKSVGPGVLDSDFSGRGARGRPSMAASGSLNNMTDSTFNGRSSISSTTSAAEAGARLASARASKAKSMQPPSGQTHLNPPAVSTPDHSRSSSFAGRSPGRVNGRGTTTPSSSARRMSVMPGMPPSSSHATGLGARTVSPTDARRMKRMSMVQGPPPMPQTPPMKQPEQSTPRASSKSPSMLPRKTSTPSSSRTTPDPNRKSYSSGLSTASTASFNTARTSTGSLQPRLPQTTSTSRLPTPKPNSRNVHSSAGNEEEEVPPVPAIPKAYESPKDSPADPPFFAKQRKSSLPFDSSSINSTSTSDWGMPPPREPVKQDSEAKSRRNADPDQKEQAPAKKKNLQPLRLPPLNLLPLSTPTAAKVAALKPEPLPEPGTTTPPPRRPTKTPSTPMTASKTSFFSRSKPDDKPEQTTNSMRSASSVNHVRAGSSTIRHVSGGGNTMPIPTTTTSSRYAVSPFVSSSLPKSDSGEYNYITRSNTTGDLTSAESGGEQPKSSRLTGPRAQKISKESNDTPTQSSPDEPTTPSSGSSLRRKLSMGWKRTTSKSSISMSHAANERDSEYPPPPPKHSDMPPPRLPASATMNNLSSTSISVPSPSPSVKSTTYLDSKRRKSSISSLSMFGNHGRTTSESYGVNGSPKKEISSISANQPKLTPRTSSSVLSSAHKMLNKQSSQNALKAQDPWTLDLDKDDLSAEDEMKKLASKRRETETAARQLDALRKRAVPKDRVSPQQALQVANLNIYERGEIIDYKDVYFCGTVSAPKHVGDLQTEAANFGYDDDRGDYSIVLGDHLSYRYEIVDVLGKGSFGQVVRCVDHKTGGLVAIKIIRNKKRFHQQALVEVNILKKLREWDPQNKHSMVNFTQSFYFRGHLCISTELLDMNLYEFIKSNSFRGFSLKLIRRFTKQLLSSLLLLKQHKVIHCDLKPENILLAHPMHSEIKVIDFGSSCFENEKVYTYIQSRFYRSPEVILGMTYGMPIDMWSVGCILAELFTGYPIFPGENEQEQLACIMEVFGPPEKHLIEKSTRKKLFFDSLGKPRLTVSSKGRRRKPSSKTLQQVLKCDDEAFLDFLARCLRWDPDRRLKPEEAVRHEFLTGAKSSVPRASAQPRASSPLKRFNTITSSSTSSARPLPEPPATSFKNGVAVRVAPTTGPSPVKAGVQRRQSAVTNFNSSTGSTASGISGVSGGAGKRVSLGGANLNSSTSSAGGSALPMRTGQRSVSGTMANAGATAAMRRG